MTKFNTDPDHPQIKALRAIHEFLLAEFTPKQAYDICMSCAGEIIALCFVGDIEAICDRAPWVLRETIAQFTTANPQLVAAKRQRAQ